MLLKLAPLITYHLKSEVTASLGTSYHLLEQVILQPCYQVTFTQSISLCHRHTDLDYNEWEKPYAGTEGKVKGSIYKGQAGRLSSEHSICGVEPEKAWRGGKRRAGASPIQLGGSTAISFSAGTTALGTLVLFNLQMEKLYL